MNVFTTLYMDIIYDKFHWVSRQEHRRARQCMERMYMIDTGMYSS